MDHLTDKQILALLTETVTDGALAEHVSQCDTCAGKLQALEASWDILGRWTVDTPAVDLTDRVLDRVEARSIIRLKQPKALIRVAASILIGAGAGSWLGQTTAQPVSDEQVSEAMHLDVLTLSSSTGLTTPLLEGAEE